MRPALLAAALTLAAPAAAQDVWIVDPEASEIVFRFVIDGRRAEGVFRRITGSGTFDPADPAAARLDLRIDVSSIDVGGEMENAFVRSADWFDDANHPEARYTLVRLHPIEADRHRSQGDLVIKGRSAFLEAALDLSIGENEARAVGEVPFDRLDFDIGVGLSALFVDVEREVSVAFDLTARRSQ